MLLKNHINSILIKYTHSILKILTASISIPICIRGTAKRINSNNNNIVFGFMKLSYLQKPEVQTKPFKHWPHAQEENREPPEEHVTKNSY